MTRPRAAATPIVRVFVQFLGADKIKVLERFRDRLEAKREGFKAALVRLMREDDTR